MVKMTNLLENFFSKYPILAYDKNQVIIHADDTPTGVFYVKNGYIKMNTILENGRQLTLNIFKEGTYFPMIWAITNISNGYFFQTVTPAQVCRAPKDALISFIKKNPDALYDLTKRILIGLDGLLTNIEHQLSGNSYHRVVSALILSARRFGQKREKNEVVIKFPLTHDEIGNIASISRETVSIVMEKLKKKGLLTYEHKLVIIKNLDSLEKEK